MRCSCLGILVLLPLIAFAADPPTPPKDEKKQAPLTPGNNLPGPFHPFCVSGPYIAKIQQQAGEKEKVRGRFHCPLSVHGLDPLVLVFVRDLRLSEPLNELLVKLDAAVEKNPALRLGVAAVFITDELPDVVGDDDKREDLAGKLTTLAQNAKLKNVALCLDSKSDLEKYDLNREDIAYTVIVSRGYRILASESILRDQLTTDKVDQILKTIGEKLETSKR
jgi:hypothetical protein